MVLKTTSQLLGYHKTIEEKQAEIYLELAKKYPEHADVFNRFGRDSLRNRDIAQRAYREGVTDAFEVGFLVDPLNSDYYALITPDGELSKVVEAVIANEETVIRFYLDAASNSSNLLPDLPETFERLIKRKRKNLEKLKDIV